MHLCLIDVIIIPLIWPTNGHDDEVLARIKTVVIYWRLKFFGIFVEPFLEF